jgi:hypothetical protein
MNELQIRLTADIRDLQSALAKAKQTLKSFETETATDSEKSNVGFRRKVGLIEQLTAKAKQLKVSLAQATNEKQIAGFNAQLEETNIELARLNALGKSFAAPAVKSFNQLKSSVGAANGSAVAFNRIIQDAPFGLLGVGNNIQQFTEQIAFLKKDLGSTSAAVKSFFGSLFTSTNLVILGVSALTAGFTAYKMGAFDAADETKDLAKELDKYKESLDSVTRAQLEGAQNAQGEIQSFKLLTTQAENANLPLEKRLRAVEELRNQFPDYLKGLSDEQILTGNVGVAYNELTKGITAAAKARAFSNQITENQTQILVLLLQEEQRALEILKERDKLASIVANKQTATGQDLLALKTQEAIQEGRIEELVNKTIESKAQRDELDLKNVQIQGKISSEIEKAGGLIDANKEKVKKAVEEVEFYDEVWNENEKRLGRISELLRKVADDIPDRSLVSLLEAPDSDPNKFKPTDTPADIVPLGIIEGLEKQISLFESLKRTTQDPNQIALYSLQIANLRSQLASLNGEEVKSNLQLIADAFGSMGQQIANSLNISNRSLRGFVTTLVSATPKIIAAIIAQSAARKASAVAANVANAQQAAGNAVVVATEGAKGLGPVGLALLPVFIAGALALVSSAFGKAGGGGGSPSAGQGSTFTNRREFGGPVSKGRAYIVGEKRPELFVPNTNGIIIPQLPSMDYSGASMAAGAMAVDVNIRGVSYGDDILFTVQQAQIRRGIR